MPLKGSGSDVACAAVICAATCAATCACTAACAAASWHTQHGHGPLHSGGRYPGGGCH